MSFVLSVGAPWGEESQLCGGGGAGGVPRLVQVGHGAAFVETWLRIAAKSSVPNRSHRPTRPKNTKTFTSPLQVSLSSPFTLLTAPEKAVSSGALSQYE